MLDSTRSWILVHEQDPHIVAAASTTPAESKSTFPLWADLDWTVESKLRVSAISYQRGLTDLWQYSVIFSLPLSLSPSGLSCQRATEAARCACQRPLSPVCTHRVRVLRVHYRPHPSVPGSAQLA